MALGTPVAAAVAYSGSGGGAGTVSPAYPSGILATDDVLLFIGQKPATANGGGIGTLTGWTLRESLTGAGGYGTTLAADTGNTNLYCYSWDAPVAGQTGNLSVTLNNNNVAWAFIVRIPGGGSYSYGSADGSRTTAPTSGSAYTVTLTNGTTAPNLQAGDIAIWAMCVPTDVVGTVFGTHTISSSGTTFGTVSELNEPTSGTNNDVGGYSAWAEATSGSSTAAPTVGATATGTVTNIRGPILLVRVRDTSQELTPGLYTNGQSFFSPTVTVGAATLAPDLYTNDQTFYSPDVTQSVVAQDLQPSLYTNNQTFYSATVTATYALTPARYDNAQTFYGPTITVGAVTLTPSLYTNGQTFFSPTVGQASAQQDLTPALYTNDQAFYSAMVTRGTITLQPALYTNTQTFYQPTVTSGAVTLQPALYTNAQTFYQPTVTPGAVTLTPARYDNAQTFYSPTVAQAGVEQSLQPQLFTNGQAFYAPTVTAAAVDLQPQLVTNASTFFAPTVTATYTLAPQDYVDPNYVDPNYIAPNTSSTQVFYSPTVTPGTATIAPALFTNSSTFFSPTVEPQSYLITKAQALELYKVWLLHGLGAPLAVGANSRTAGAVQQSVSQSGGTVTVATTGAPTVVVGDPGTMIQELSALHGLTTNLVTTASSRTAGAIVQAFSTSGTTTTVTRQ